MAFLEIPTRNDLPSYSERVELEGAIYILKIRHNERMNLWFMDVLNEAEEPLAEGLPMFTKIPLLSQIIKEGLPPGDFILLNRENEDENAGRNDLGDKVKLFYQEASDFE